MLIFLGLGLVAVVGLGLYVVLVELRSPTTEQLLDQQSLVFDLKDEGGGTLPQTATRLEIRRSDLAIVLEKIDEQRWRVRKPFDARADRSAVLAILTDLGALRAEGIVKRATLADLGLDPPRLRVTLAAGEQRLEFAVGAKARGAKAKEAKAYLRVGDSPNALVVDGAAVSKLDRTPYQFRDRRVFDRARRPEGAKTVRVLSAERKLVLTREAGVLKLTSPVDDLADEAASAEFVRALVGLEAKGYVTENADDLAAYGLDEPRLTCEVICPDGPPMTLLVGKSCGESGATIYAKRGEEPTIFSIAGSFLAAATPKLESLRQRRVSAVSLDELSVIEIQRGEETLALGREPGSDRWRLLSPEQTPASEEAVMIFVKALGDLRVQRWVDDPWSTAHEFFRTPAATITLTRRAVGGQQPPPLKLHVSRALKSDELDGRFLQRDGQKCLLYVSSKQGDARASLEARESVQGLVDLNAVLDGGHYRFLDPAVLRFDADHVSRLLIERDDALLDCQRTRDGWELTVPAEMAADPLNVASILGTMGKLDAAHYVPEPQPDLMAYGLLDPALSLTAFIAAPGKAPVERTLHLSNPVKGVVYGRTEGGRLVFAVRSYDVRALLTEPIATSLGDFEETDVVGLSLARRGQQPIGLSLGPKGWALTSAGKAPLSQASVRALIRLLRDFRIPRYIDYEARRSAVELGLAPPLATVTVKVKGKEDIVVEVGNTVPEDDGSSAIVRGRKPIFLLPRASLEDWVKAFEALGQAPRR